MRPPMLFEAFERLQAIEERGPVFLRAGCAPEHLSFAQLMAQARALQGALQAQGVAKGARVGLAAGDHADFIVAFLALALAGAVPVPAPAPSPLAGQAGFRAAAAGIFAAARIDALLASHAALGALGAPGAMPWRVLEIGALRAAGHAAPAPRDVDFAPGDTCFIQFTSGSTSAPKGVVVSHANLAANARAIACDALELDPCADVGVSWLPLHHDMGLVGNVLTALLYAIPVVYLPTLQFVRNARCWMKAVSDHRATVTFGPNFALALAAARADPAHVGALDLGSLRILGCGAEPICADVLRHFAAVHEAAGLRPQALRPCYGMAEATLAVSFATGGAGPRTATLLRHALENDGQARAPASAWECRAACVELVSCGEALPGHALAIVDAHGSPLPENRVGQVVVRGPSVAAGYLDNAAATAESFRDGWLQTGDLGFLRDGELFIVGRVKDLVIIHGRNYIPHDLERAVETIDGIRPGGVAAFAVGERATERLVIVAETRMADPAPLGRQVRDTLLHAFGIGRLEVLFASPGSLPKTTSGKLQRGRARTLYQQGVLAG